MPLSCTTTYRVPYADTDQMGVVYYGNYLTLFERCRNELMRASPLTYRDMEAQGLALPVIEAHVDYKRPAKYDDLLELRGVVTSAKGCQIRIDVEVHRDGELLAQGYTVHCCMSLATRRPVRLPPELVEGCQSTSTDVAIPHS